MEDDAYSVYIIGGFITGAISAIGIWIYAMAEWGLLLGLVVGWIPAMIGGIILGLIWPLVALVVLYILWQIHGA